MGLVGGQNITKHVGVGINPTAQFQPASHISRVKMLNVLDVAQIHNVRQILRVEISTSRPNS
jgi:hypothetical protein